MSTRIAGYEEVVPLILALPVGTYYTVESDGSLEIQAQGEAVTAVRRAFPRVIWKKTPPGTRSMCDWWTYHATLEDGRKIKIYADRVGPKSCKRIEETVTETQMVEVPVETRREEREVTRTRVRWECPEGDVAET